MAPTDVYVHVGPHKTGTTFVQQVLRHNESALAADGFLLPGREYKDQRAAVKNLLKSRQSPADIRPLPRRWRQLVAEVRSWPGRAVVISSEHLDEASSAAMRTLVESFAPARVHVVYTARDFTQVVPAMWQTMTRNGRSVPWEDYIAQLRSTEDTSRWLYHMAGQDPARVFAAWEEHVPADRIQVVVVPPSGSPPNVLWERFSSVMGLTAGAYSLEVPRDNKSLGAAETEFLQRLNFAGAGKISRAGYRRWVQQLIGRSILEPRSSKHKVGLGSDDYSWAASHARRFADGLREGRYPVTGDLDELLPPSTRPELPPPGSADESELLEISLEVTAGLLATLDAEKTAKRGRASLPKRGAEAVVRRAGRRMVRSGRRLRQRLPKA